MLNTEDILAQVDQLTVDLDARIKRAKDAEQERGVLVERRAVLIEAFEKLRSKISEAEDCMEVPERVYDMLGVISTELESIATRIGEELPPDYTSPKRVASVNECQPSDMLEHFLGQPFYSLITWLADPETYANELCNKMYKLQGSATLFSAPELQAYSRALAAASRLLQKRYPVLECSAGSGNETMRKFYAALAAFAREYRVTVHALKKDYECDWDAEIREQLAALSGAVKARNEAIKQQEEREQQEVLYWNTVSLLVDYAHGKESPNKDEILSIVDDLSRIPSVPPNSPNQHELTDRLAEVLWGVEDHLTGRKYRSLRRILTAYQERIEGKSTVEDTTPEGEEETEDNTCSKTYTDKLVGKRILIIGSKPRGNRKQLMQEALKAEELEWLVPEDARSISTWLQNDKYDVVFVIIRFCSHEGYEMAKAACKASDKTFVTVAGGYGASSLSNSYETAISNSLY